MFGCLVDRLYRDNVTDYAGRYEDVCYGAAGERRVGGGIMREVWPLKERKADVGEVCSR